MVIESRGSNGRSIAFKFLWALTVGLVTFLGSALLDGPFSVTLTDQLVLTVLAGGITIVSQFLLDLEQRVEGMQVDLARFATTAESRSESAIGQTQRQLDLMTRNLEQQLARIVGEHFNLGQKDEPIVREMAHSLGTPLAQMETVLLLEKSVVPESGASASNSHLLAGVQVCKSFVIAFREVATMARDTEAWQPESLSRLVQAVGPLYATRVNREVTFDIDLPTQVKGYGNNFLMAVLLPLIENAVEAAPDGSMVSARFALVEGGYEIEIGNHAHHGLTRLPVRMLEPHWTSKSGHQGLGLASVLTLLNTVAGATVQPRIENMRVILTVYLPWAGTT